MSVVAPPPLCETRLLPAKQHMPDVARDGRLAQALAQASHGGGLMQRLAGLLVHPRSACCVLPFERGKQLPKSFARANRAARMERARGHATQADRLRDRQQAAPGVRGHPASSRAVSLAARAFERRCRAARAAHAVVGVFECDALRRRYSKSSNDAPAYGCARVLASGTGRARKLGTKKKNTKKGPLKTAARPHQLV